MSGFGELVRDVRYTLVRRGGAQKVLRLPHCQAPVNAPVIACNESKTLVRGRKKQIASSDSKE